MRPIRRRLVIVAKAPRPGHSKTRLVPPLAADEGAALSRAFLLDTVTLGLSLNWESVWVVHPAGDGPLLEAMLPRGVRCVQQTGNGLGAALRGVCDTCFADGCQRVVLIDSDSPTLPSAVLHAAEQQLATHNVAIGPSADGGYYLLALRQPQPALFDGIAWSTPAVYQQTLARAAELGLSVADIDEWYDVDTPADLARLEADLRSQPPHVAVHTRSAVERFRARVAR